MSNKSRKTKSSKSPKQEPERASEKAMRESAELEKEATQAAHDIHDATKTAASAENRGLRTGCTRLLPDEPFSFETTLKEVDKPMQEVVIVLHAIADKLNTEAIFGIPAARFQTFADKIKKYPKQLKAKAAKERRRLTQTETKEERKDKKAKIIRERIAAMQKKLAEL